MEEKWKELKESKEFGSGVRSDEKESEGCYNSTDIGVEPEKEFDVKKQSASRVD